MAIYLSKQNGNWSSATTWTSALPTNTFNPVNAVFSLSAVGNAALPPQSNANDKIFIRHTVVYDVPFGIWGDGMTTPHSSDNTSTLAFGNLNAIWLSGGTLKCSRDINTDFVAKGAVIIGKNGWLDWGTKTDPLTTTSNFYVSADVSGSSGIIQPYFSDYLNSYANAGTITIYGQTKVRNTTLALSAAAGLTTITVASAYNWNVGDKLIIETDTVLTTSVLSAHIASGYVSGSTIVPLTTSLNFNRSVGTNVSNFTSNVTIDSYTGSNVPCGIYTYTGTPSKNQYGYFTIKDIGTTRWFASSNGHQGYYPNYNSGGPNGIRPDAALVLNGVQGNIPLVADGLAFDWSNRLSLAAARVAFVAPPGLGTNSLNDSCFYYATTPSTSYTLAAILADKSSICEFNRNIVYNAGVAVGGDAVENAKYNNCTFTSTVAYSPFATTNNFVTFNTCTFKANATYILDSNITNIVAFKFNKCNITLAQASSATNLLLDFSLKKVGSYAFTDCSFSNIRDTNLTLNKNKGWPTTLYYTLDVFTPNLSSFDNKRANTFYEARSVTGVRKNGITSLRLQTETLGLSSEYFINQQIAGVINTPLKLKGNLRYDSAFAPAGNISNGSATPPSVTLDGLGISQTFTCPSTPDVWFPFEFNVTPSSTGNIDLYLKAKSASTTSYCYLDGLTLFPFIKTVRWYGYVFDSFVSKTINSLTTLTENQVSAISTVNILDYLYDASNYWSVTNPSLTSYTDLYTQNGKILDFGSRNITLSSASTGFTYLSGTSTIILNTVSLSAGVNFDTITTTGTITLASQTLSNITVNANVNQTTPSNLTGVTINGILSYNTNSPYAITYTNTNVLTARNLGSGTVTIQQINSTITDPKAPQIQTYAATYIKLTNLNGGYVAIYDQNGVQQYYTNSDQTIALPASSTGIWTYKIGRYGYKMSSGSFTINPSVGGTITIDAAPNYVQDIYVNDLVTNVVNYTDFTSTQNIYDYLSYYRTTSNGLSSGELNSYITSLDIGTKPLILSDTASPVFTYDGSKFVIKSSSIQGKTITTTGGINLSGSTTFSNITLNSDVSSNVVGNLNSVNVNGILTYNTNTPTNIIYTNTNVLTARNDGFAIVNIKRVNSTITDATDAQIENYAPTYLDLTLQSGYIAIYDNNGVQQYYRNTDTNSSPIELPYSATGTWTYRIAKYGSKLVTGSFTINSAVGGTVTIAPIYVQDIYVSDTVGNVMSYTTFYKTQQVYDYLSYYRTTSAGLSAGDLNSYISTLDIGSKNIILFDSASPVFSYDGSTFTLNSLNLSGAAIKTTGTISLSGNSAISDITLTTDVLDQTPADLTNVVINGTLAYSTNTPASITYTNTTVSTVVNDPYSAKVLIKRVNSSINNDTDPEIDNYAPTIINVNPLSGSVAIYNNSSTREYFINEVSTIVLPYNATGTWSYKVAKYGYNLIDESFTINSSTGATINIVPNYIPDNFITTNLQTVSTYTDLTNSEEIHNYLMYFQTLSTGIDYGDLESESFGTITFTGNVALSSNASEMVSVSGNTLILKSTNITDSIVLVSPGDITSYAGNTISDGIKLRTASFDSEVYMNLVDSLTLYPSEIDRDNNNTTNSIYLASPTIYRFKYGSVVNGVTLSNYLYGRVIAGGAIILIKTPISTGTNQIDFGTTGNLTTIISNLKVINSGVQKSSILVPHTTNI